MLKRLLNFYPKSATEICNEFYKVDVNMTNNEFVVLTTVTSLTVFVIYCGSPYEFISDY